MKSHKPSAAHTALRDDMVALIRKHGANLEAAEILAIAAHMVGQLIALQDQRKMTREMALQIVSANIEQGNQEVVGKLTNESQGAA